MESFKLSLDWLPQGKTFNYNSYSREAMLRVAGKPDLIGTAAKDYKGSAYHHNPEDMLVMSLSLCHMLSYLALCSNSKIEVLSYHDNAEGELTKDGQSIKFGSVKLKPKVIISATSDLDKAKALHDKAHHICFIANSVNFPVDVAPEIEIKS